MAYLNNCQFVGNVGQKPETRVVGPEKRVTSLRLAVSKRVKGRNGFEEKTTWINVVAWQSLGDFAGRLEKGDMVFVAGELDVRTWEDKNGGGKRSSFDIIARDIQSLRRKEGAAAHSSSEPTESDDPGYTGGGDPDLPF